MFEQAPEYKEIGAGIGIGPNAIHILETLGLKSSLAAIKAERKGTWMRVKKWDNGEVVVDVPLLENAGSKAGSFHRGELLTTLLVNVRKNPRIILHTNKQCKGVQRNDSTGKMTIKFQDGKNAEADLVIAADGIHSAVRSSYITDNAVFSGIIAYRGLIDINRIYEFWPREEARQTGFWSGYNKHFMTYPISKDGHIFNVIGFAPGEAKESWVSTTKREEVQRQYAGWDPVVQKIIECMDDEPGCWAVFERRPYDRWVFDEGKVVLLGDAAHSMQPHQGQGGSQSIEDAYVLARSLSEYFKQKNGKLLGVAKFLELYQSIRLPRTARVQETSRETGALYEQRAPPMTEDMPEEERYAIVRKTLQTRFSWLWSWDADKSFNEALEKLD